ncbi:MAG: hypothetical protein RRB13_06310 [bacterium]|nr:hypothetical protein [bacterium]
MISISKVIKEFRIPSLPSDRVQLEVLLGKGRELALGGHDSTALYHWTRAAGISSSETLAFVKKLFSQWRIEGPEEALLTAGLMLLKLEKAAPPLTNFLGNLARRQDNLGLAKKLYAVGVKAAPLHKLSLFNLAATTAKLPLYDAAIPQLIKKWLPTEEVVLPAYQSDREVIQKITAALHEEKKLAKEKRLVELADLQEEAERNMDALKMHGYTTEVKTLSQSDCMPSSDEVLAVLEKEVELDQQDPDRVAPLFAQKRLYDLGLYALSLERAALARTCFDRLVALETPLPHIPLLLGMTDYLEKGVDAGLEALNDCLHKDPKDRYVTANIGLMHLREGHRYSGALYRLLAANLLECSNGHFHYPDFLAEAQAAYEDPDRQRLALKLYNQIALEREDPTVWARIAKLNFDANRLKEAAQALKEWLVLEPNNAYAKEKLVELSEAFLAKGQQLETEKKYKASMKVYLQAAEIAKTPELLKRIEEGFYRFKQPLKAKQAEMERHVMVMMEQRKRAAKQQEELLKVGMAYLRNGVTKKAATTLEKALELKANLPIYQTLCLLYKDEGNEKDLYELESRWADMLAEEEEMAKREKEFHWYYAGL